MVGAYNVGSIRITNPEDPVTTNKPHELIYSKHRHHKHYRQPWDILAGDRVGTFELGSTVVMAFEAPTFHWLVEPGAKVKMGQPIGYVGDRNEEVDAVLTQYAAMMEAYKRGCEEKEGGVEEVETVEEEEIVMESESEMTIVGEQEEEEGGEESEIIPIQEEGKEDEAIPEKEEFEEEIAEEDEEPLVCEVADVITELTAIVQVNEEPIPIEVPNSKEIEEVLEEMDWNLSRGEREEHYW